MGNHAEPMKGVASVSKPLTATVIAGVVPAEQLAEIAVFQLASVSKPLTATVIAGVVSDRIVTWDSRTSAVGPRRQALGGDSWRWPSAFSA
jgi:CubicO group peptidase (beta-lactamase class C family)